MSAVITETIHGRSRRGSTRMTSRPGRNATPTDQKEKELPRAASYTYLPAAKGEQLGSGSVVNIETFPGANYPPNQPRREQDVSHSDHSLSDSSGWNTPDDHGPTIASPRAKDIAAQLRKSMSNKHRNISAKNLSSIADSYSHNATTESVPRLQDTKSLAQRFFRHSSISSASSSPSRSPSPKRQDGNSGNGAMARGIGQRSDGRTEKSRRPFISRRQTIKSSRFSKDKDEEQYLSDGQEPKRSLMRRGSLLRRKSLVRASSEFSKESQTGSLTPPVPELPKSYSTDRLPNLRSVTSSVDRAVPLPMIVSTNKIHAINPLTRKKDELWGVFRTLDADYSKFSSKSSALKANVVRNSLIPFLRTYATHPSNTSLRLEDLDRRINILNRWWNGLIELLHGRNNQSISGTDRPVILDGVLGIMERSEWRLYPSQFCPLSERVRSTLADGNPSHTSPGSSSSDFLADSVHHNVRNIFIQNMSSQMAFVVEKMSLRNAPASLVSFCGRACAYAFFFVPGMADVLVRLWEVPMDLIRRVLQETGIGRFDKLPQSTNDLLTNFPPALQQLGFSSLTPYMRQLRRPPTLHPGTNHIEWWGRWVERWSGRESDLFYVFVKHFHILLADFLPSNTTKAERLGAPGLLLVHAQVLSNLDATIHRDVSHLQQDSSLIGPSATLDELFGDPDAIAPTVPVPPVNATRLMAENRLVMLVRDFLLERTSDHRNAARDMFARSFSDLLQAATRGTSMFDHSACYTLLDFLEEALVILARFQHFQKPDTPLIDPHFWQSAFRKMIDSESTMTEIRLYAFLYTVWNAVFDSKAKLNMCQELLLEPDIFESRFNHWCPMVRAYYMRLLCWRLARYDSDEDGDDLDLLEMIQQRLLSTWSYYLFLRQKADDENAPRPATNPCYPAPGRRLLIVRTDNQINNAEFFLTFEGLGRDPPSPMGKPAWKRTGSTSILNVPDSRPGSSSSTTISDGESPQKGIGGFLRKMMGGGNERSRSRGPEAQRPVADLVRGRGAVLARSAAGDNDQIREVKCAEQTQQPSLSFIFSLEFHPNTRALPPMRLFPPRLPPSAQRYLEAGSRKSPLAEGGMRPVEPVGDSVARSRYSGRALAEWTMIVGECHSFFERRKNEGVPTDRLVETPMLGVEVFKRAS